MRRWVEHTGEVELEIDASSERDVFVDALAGLAELLGGEDEGGAGPGADAQATYDVVLHAGDRPGLLVAWLEELLWLSERDRVVPERVSELTLGGDRLQAKVLAARRPPRPLVKGVTWHELRFERHGDRLHARVVLDV